jgi:hypothetical protein
VSQYIFSLECDGDFIARRIFEISCDYLNEEAVYDTDSTIKFSATKSGKAFESWSPPLTDFNVELSVQVTGTTPHEVGEHIKACIADTVLGDVTITYVERI